MSTLTARQQPLLVVVDELETGDVLIDVEGRPSTVTEVQVGEGIHYRHVLIEDTPMCPVPGGSPRPTVRHVGRAGLDTIRVLIRGRQRAGYGPTRHGLTDTQVAFIAGQLAGPGVPS